MHEGIAELDPNHTHFILVDDGRQNAYGGEIKFRAQLERELRMGKSQKHYENRRIQTNSGDNISYNEKDYEESDTVQLKKGLKQDIIPMVLIVVQVIKNSNQNFKLSKI